MCKSILRLCNSELDEESECSFQIRGLKIAMRCGSNYIQLPNTSVVSVKRFKHTFLFIILFPLLIYCTSSYKSSFLFVWAQVARPGFCNYHTFYFENEATKVKQTILNQEINSHRFLGRRLKFSFKYIQNQ